MFDLDQQRSTWWGQYSLGVNQTALWEIGPLTLAILRRVDEWQIAYEPLSDTDPDTTNWQFQPSALNIGTLDYAKIERYASSETGEAVWLLFLANKKLTIWQSES